MAERSYTISEKKWDPDEYREQKVMDLDFFSKKARVNKATSPALEAERLKYTTSERNRPISERSSRASLMEARTSRFRTGMNAAGWIWSILVIAVIFFLFIGPGIAAITYIFEAISWYWWVAILAVGILIIRRR